MTTQYVFIKSSACSISNNMYKIDLGIENNRPPTQIIEVISIVFESITYHPYISVRSDFQAANGFTNDGYPNCLTILQYNQEQSAGHNLYNIVSLSDQPKYTLSYSKSFNMFFENDSGDTITSANILSFVMLIKIISPIQEQITKDYRKEISLQA